MWIVCQADSSHEMSWLIFYGKKIIEMSAAAVDLCFKTYTVIYKEDLAWTPM